MMNRAGLMLAKRVTMHTRWAIRVRPDHDKKPIGELTTDELVPLRKDSEDEDFNWRKLYLEHIIQEALKEAESKDIIINHRQPLYWRAISDLLREVESLLSKLSPGMRVEVATQIIGLAVRHYLDVTAKKNVVEDIGGKALKLLEELDKTRAKPGTSRA